LIVLHAIEQHLRTYLCLQAANHFKGGIKLYQHENTCFRLNAKR